jgi:tetratricopeptide (TPR) repeat protein
MEPENRPKRTKGTTKRGSFTMRIHEEVTRRSFLSGLLTAAAGAGLNAFMPLPVRLLGTASPESEIRPYWLEVLSRGVGYFPENISAYFSDWTPAQLKGSAHCSLTITLDMNRRVLASPSLPGQGEMDKAVERSKTTQCLYERLMRLDSGDGAGPGPASTDGLYHGRLLYDLSGFIIRHTMEKVDSPWFTGFSPFDTTLLGSCLTYVRESIRIGQDASDASPEELRDALMGSLGSCYNNLGLALSYLGEVQQAQEAFTRALELRPNNRAILRNLEDMDAKGLIVHRKLYSRILAD